MPDIEKVVLSKVIETGALTDLVAAGFEVDHFVDPLHQDVYEYMLEFQRKHEGSTPSALAVRKKFRKFKPLFDDDPLSYHLEQLNGLVRKRISIDLVRDFHDAIEDPEQVQEIELHALDMARQLNELSPSSSAGRFSDGLARAKKYEERLKNGITHGIYMGVPSIDVEMLGIQPHEMVTIAGYQGMGKSTFLQHIAYSSYLQGKTVLYISLEMEEEAILRRIDVMATNVKYHALKALELDAGSKKQWEEMLERAESEKEERDIIVRDNIKNCTVDKVLAETMRYKPDVVLVDYLELMSGPKAASSWEQISYAGIGLKQNARVMKIPVVTAAQLNRDGGKGDVTLANIGQQSIGKHSDVVIGLSRDDDMEAAQEMDVIALKLRDSKKVRAKMRWQLETMEIKEIGTEDRFPVRDKKNKLRAIKGGKDPERAALQRARTIGGEENPFKAKKKKLAA